MIWYFLAGMIGGAVGVILFIGWWARTHMRKVTKEEMIHALEDAENGNGTGGVPGREVSEPERNADGADHMGSASEQRVADTEPGQGTEDR